MIAAINWSGSISLPNNGFELAMEFCYPGFFVTIASLNSHLPDLDPIFQSSYPSDASEDKLRYSHIRKKIFRTGNGMIALILRYWKFAARRYCRNNSMTQDRRLKWIEFAQRVKRTRRIFFPKHFKEEREKHCYRTFPCSTHYERGSADFYSFNYSFPMSSSLKNAQKGSFHQSTV